MEGEGQKKASSEAEKTTAALVLVGLSWPEAAVGR